MKTYVTVAIPYVNADPHLGYAYELVAGRRLRPRPAARWRRRALPRRHRRPLAEERARRRRRRRADAGLRRPPRRPLRRPRRAAARCPSTTSSAPARDPRHGPAVERLWRACAANGDLYRRHYEGDYCVGCEQFYDADELSTGAVPSTAQPLDRVAEENWFFRLSAYQDAPRRADRVGRLRDRPGAVPQEVLAFVRRGLHDISVSRSVERARGWGIPVPDDPDQVVYVWFDALTNYLSALGYGDPASPTWRRGGRAPTSASTSSARASCASTPCTGRRSSPSAGQPPPTRIQVHPYLTVDGAKLSKSSGQRRRPGRDRRPRTAPTPLRWWFARDVARRRRHRLHAPSGSSPSPTPTSPTGSATSAGACSTLARRRGVDPVGTGGRTASMADAVLAALGDFDLRAATAATVAAVSALNREIERRHHGSCSPTRAVTPSSTSCSAGGHQRLRDIARRCRRSPPSCRGLSDSSSLDDAPASPTRLAVGPAG